MVEQLKLENQICFPFYAISRLITKQYQPHLDEIGLTYPQYLVMLVLWEYEKITVNEIAHKLILQTNTITPLLKRMEKMNLLSKTKDTVDSRKTFVELTSKGKKLQSKAACIPSKLVGGDLMESGEMESMLKFRQQLYALLNGMLAAEKISEE